MIDHHCFRPEVLSYSIKGVPLDKNLSNLAKVCNCGATDAVIFYCARIVEVLSKEAHSAFFGKEYSLKSVIIEKELWENNLFSQNSYYWSKGLRLLGNEARHEFRDVTIEESTLALIFLVLLLKWYFCEFPLGKRYPSIFAGNAGLSTFCDKDILELICLLEDNLDGFDDLEKLIFGSNEQRYVQIFAKNLTIPLLLIEQLLSKDKQDAAGRLIEIINPLCQGSKGALKQRYDQLLGLYYSRTDKLEDALKVLEPDFRQQQMSHPDRLEDELIGILAGIYKRFWDRDGNTEYLKKSHNTYLLGWERNRTKQNVYLGINAATTALWLDQFERAKSVARDVNDILEKRRRIIRKKTRNLYDLNYWDLATLAEAKLLISDFENAKLIYDFAFDRYNDKTKNIFVTKKQLSKLVNRLSVDIFREMTLPQI